MSIKENVYTAETTLGTLAVKGRSEFQPTAPGDIPDPLGVAYAMEFLLNGEKFSEIEVTQITKDEEQGFSEDTAVLYCDSQSEELGEIAFQLFDNGVTRPNMPIDTFLLLSSLDFVAKQPKLVMECVKGVFAVQHCLDAEHPARYMTFLADEKTPEFDLLKAAGIPFFYCVEPMCLTEDTAIAFYDCNAFKSELVRNRMEKIEETPKAKAE